MERGLYAVTGAASGIGAATTDALLRSGAFVIALDRNVPANQNVEFVDVDMSDPISIATAAERLPAGLSGLINVAGVPGTGGPESVSKVNYLGLRTLTWATLPKIRKGGSIVNVASTAGENWRENVTSHLELAAAESFEKGLLWLDLNPWPKDQAYAWFKEALVVWTKLNAAVLRRSHEVRLNCISPGAVDTPILGDFRVSLGDARFNDTINRGGGVGSPAAVAEAILFLASSRASWIIGADLVVDGGASASRLVDYAIAKANIA